MMDIRKSTDDQIRGLLDSTQQKKWDEMQAKHDNGCTTVTAVRRKAGAPPQQ